MAREMGSVVDRIVRDVATETDSDPSELPPLYDAVDPDALAAVTETMADGTVSFAYADHVVRVDADGDVMLADRPTGTGAGRAASGD